MAQFDVYANPNPATKRTIPFLFRPTDRPLEQLDNTRSYSSLYSLCHGQSRQTSEHPIYHKTDHRHNVNGRVGRSCGK